MRLAICGCSPGETRYLCKCIQHYCARIGCSAEIFPIYDMEQFWQGFGPGRYHGVLMGLGDTAGFLAARRIREQDAGCRLVVMDDTPRYAIQYLRIHAADFLLRPAEEDSLHRSFRRLMGMN